MKKMKKIKGVITFKALSSHPDTTNTSKVFEYSDTYNINTYNFFSTEHYMDYIKKDLILIASGGYEYNHINIINIELIELR